MELLDSIEIEMLLLTGRLDSEFSLLGKLFTLLRKFGNSNWNDSFDLEAMDPVYGSSET